MLRSSFSALAVLTLLGVPLLLAQQPTAESQRTPTEQARLDVGPLVRDSNRTGVELFSKLSANTGNVACSPSALTETLALVSSGARDQTRTELKRVLPPLGETRLQAATVLLIRDLEVGGPTSPGRMVRSGTGLWPPANTRFSADFLALAQRYYPEGLNSVQPGGTIRAAAPAELAAEMPVIEAGRNEATPPALLVSDAGFKGVWAFPFARGETRDEPFTLGNGTKVQASLMRQTGTFGYSETPELQILEMPYQDRDLRFVVVLPRKKDGLADLEKNLTLDRLARLTSGLNRREVDVVLPRFQAVLRLRLRSELERLGIRQAFSPQAQFTNLTAEKQPRLEQVIQDVSFEVDEGVGPQSPLPNPMPDRQAWAIGPTAVRADHPFLFILRDASRGGIVFIGRVNDPTVAVKK
jgi:serpin B